MQQSNIDEQAEPTGVHAHCPPLHVPLQQSAPCLQACLSETQQRPAVQLVVVPPSQQSLSLLHAPPIGEQHCWKLLQVRPAQQLPPLPQLDPACEQQLPCSHVVPEQQSPGELQACPVYPQQAPFSQCPEQHSSWPVQAVLTVLHAAQAPVWQVSCRPPQHEGLDGSQAVPVVPQQWPPSHCPLQQSMPLAQVSRSPLHWTLWHWPPTQCNPVQHGEPAEQAAPSAWHWHWPFWQARSAQQSLVLEQLPARGVQVQKPDSQRKPGQQSSTVEQVSPWPPHFTHAVP